MADNIEPGDVVEVSWKGSEFRGRFISKDDKVTVIKLQTGYNLSLYNKSVSSIKLVEKRNPRSYTRESVKGSGKRVFILGTGGTIASYVDYETGAVKPLTTAQEMLFAQPELANIADCEAEVILNILSENITKSNWVTMARKIYDKMLSGEGVVVTHGTDTLSFSSSAISFMIENPKSPIIFTASQRSPDRPSSDAYLNMLGSVKAAQSDLGEVAVVMHSSTSDDLLAIHSGVRLRKMHSSRRDAFKSINSEVLGYIDRKLNFEWKSYRKIDEKQMKLFDKLSERVALLYFYPGMSKEMLNDVLEKNDGLILAGTGLGHVTDRFVQQIKDYTSQGKIIGMTSQCFYGSVNLNVYSTGRELLGAGVVPLLDMLPEVAYTKLSFLMGNFDYGEARTLLVKNMRGEISDRRQE